MRVLVACEFSGRVRDAFSAVGHDAWSVDTIRSSETPGQHWIGDCRDYLDRDWDIVIAHPPCTYLSRAAAHRWKDEAWNNHLPASLALIEAIWSCPAPRVAIENPIGRLSSLWTYPSQIVHPWMFGEAETKPTCLWLRGLPSLMSTSIVVPTRKFKRVMVGTSKGGLGASNDYIKRRRMRTYHGIARAMAEQWGSWPLLDTVKPDR